MLRTIALNLAKRSSAAEVLLPGLRAPGTCALGQVGISRSFSAQASPKVDEEQGNPEVFDANAPQPHPGLQVDEETKSSYWLMQPAYDRKYVEAVRPFHREPEDLRDRIGYRAVQLMRSAFDIATGYGHEMTEKQWMRRFIFLETVAGVPGFVAGMLRHMRSLRSMKRDHGWIHTLLEEAENERMHLLTFLNYRQPGLLMRGMVLIGQGVFVNSYLLAYMLSPKTCHSFVGYLEEEAIKTYTRAIEELDAGKIPAWNNLPAPEIARKYWRLADDATMRDVLLVVRADEACHSHVNHVFAKMKATDENPFKPGTVHVP